MMLVKMLGQLISTSFLLECAYIQEGEAIYESTFVLQEAR